MKERISRRKDIVYRFCEVITEENLNDQITNGLDKNYG